MTYLSLSNISYLPLALRQLLRLVRPRPRKQHLQLLRTDDALEVLLPKLVLPQKVFQAFTDTREPSQ